MLGGLFKMFSKTGRNLRKKESAMERARAKAQLADIESEIGFRELEDPREQAQMRQSLFARGMGKSSIATQNQARLGDIQARRRAVLARQKDLAHRGLSLIRLRARAARRFMPFDTLDTLTQMAGGAASMYGMGKDVGAWGAVEPEE